MKARAKIYSIPKLVYMYEKMYVLISYLDFKSVVSHCCLKFYKKVYSSDWGLADALVYSIVPQRSSPLHMIPLVWHYTKHSRSTLIVLLVACFEILSEPKLFGHWISIRRCVSLCWCSLLIFFLLQWVFFFPFSFVAINTWSASKLLMHFLNFV